MPNYVPFNDDKALMQAYLKIKHPIINAVMNELIDTNEYIYNQHMIRPKLMKMISFQISIHIEEQLQPFNRYLTKTQQKQWQTAIAHGSNSKSLLSITEMMTKSDRNNRKINQKLIKYQNTIKTQWRNQTTQQILNHFQIDISHPLQAVIERQLKTSLQLELKFSQWF